MHLWFKFQVHNNMNMNTNMKLTQAAISIVEIAYCIEVKDSSKDNLSSFDFDGYDDWFDQDLEWIMRT